MKTPPVEKSPGDFRLKSNFVSMDREEGSSPLVDPRDQQVNRHSCEVISPTDKNFYNDISQSPDRCDGSIKKVEAAQDEQPMTSSQLMIDIQRSIDFEKLDTINSGDKIEIVDDLQDI